VSSTRPLGRRAGNPNASLGHNLDTHLSLSLSTEKQDHGLDLSLDNELIAAAQGALYPEPPVAGEVKTPIQIQGPVEYHAEPPLHLKDPVEPLTEILLNCENQLNPH
jgi:hypothetical protein